MAWNLDLFGPMSQMFALGWEPGRSVDSRDKLALLTREPGSADSGRVFIPTDLVPIPRSARRDENDAGLPGRTAPFLATETPLPGGLR